jgi:hypothetical protein
MATGTIGFDDKNVSATSTAIHQSSHRSGKRFRQFLRPNGRKVHIAQTPEEHARLKTELHPPEDFDIYIHGTDEHVRLPPSVLSEAGPI